MPHELELDLQHILRYTQSVWPSLAGANVLLTGATGFVGSWLVDSFLQANQQHQLKGRLFLLTRNPQAFRAEMPQLTIFIGDLKTFRFPPEPFHYIVHAAAEHQSACECPDALIRANLKGSERVLEIAQAHNTRKILFTSSGAVYGDQPSDVPLVSENRTRSPQTPYAIAKKVSEDLFMKSEVDAVITRLFTFVGPYLPIEKNFAVGNFVRDAIRGGPIRVEGDGTPLRSYLYGADLAIWLWTLLVKGKPGRAYNVGSDQAVSIFELAETVEKVCGVKRGISVAQLPHGAEPPKRYVPSIDRARLELGLHSFIPLEQGIQLMFEWHRRRYTSTK